MKKSLAVGLSGIAALGLGAGLFAWSANSLTATGGVTAGDGAAASGCTTAALTVNQNTPVYNGTNWTVNGATVSFDPADTACNGLTMTLSALNGSTVLSTGTSPVSVTSVEVSNDNVNTSISLGAAQNLQDVTDWTVVIG